MKIKQKGDAYENSDRMVQKTQKVWNDACGGAFDNQRDSGSCSFNFIHKSDGGGFSETTDESSNLDPETSDNVDNSDGENDSTNGDSDEDDVEKNTTNTDTTSYVMVDEIYSSSLGSFYAINLNTLLQYITGDETASVDSMGIIDTLAASTWSASDIRATTINGKTSSQDVQVTFGGLTWQVMYLSQDNDDNAILTLWLSNNEQDAWSDRSATEGLYYGYIDGALYSDWSADWYSSSISSYPSTMYGSSYINAVTLNNGGYYATSTSDVTLASKSANSAFAIFTMSQDELDSAGSTLTSLTDYLVTPSSVSWQETEYANSTDTAGFTYTTSNDAYGTPAVENWEFSSYNYSEKKYYTSWASNYLWLPSVSETGQNTTYTGIWNTNIQQRRNYDGSTNSFDVTAIGSSNSNYGTSVSAFSWLRSAGSSTNGFFLNSGGGYSGPCVVNSSLAVRPALHLNLTAAAENSSGFNYDENGNYWYFEDGEFPQSAVTDEDLIANLGSALILDRYVIGGKAFTVCSYGDEEYAIVTIGSNSAWFLVEPIRWIVGYGEDEPTSYDVAVSAYVLTCGSVSSSAAGSDWDWTESTLLDSVADLESATSFTIASEATWNYDAFVSTVGQSFVTDDATTASSILTVASVEEIDALGGTYKAQCSDFVAFLLSGGTTTSGYVVDYWTRDLAYELDSSSYYGSKYGATSYEGYYNSGVYVGADGLISNAWLDECMGARLSVKIG